LTADLIIGDVFEALATIPDASVDLVLTSPPFLALRSYLPADHPDKAKEIGSEPTPAAFIDTLLRVTTELRRVLAPHGSICVELGDTYSGSGGAGGDYNTDGLRDGQPKFRAVGSREHRPEREGTSADGGERLVPLNGGPGWPLDKSLTCIPDLYQVALAYGINPLTGIRSPAGRWRVRNKRAWCRPNPPVGALGDKVRPATSYMVMACTARDRWFDLDAVRSDDLRAPSVRVPEPKALAAEELGHHGKGMPATGTYHANGGAPPLDWVNIPTQPYKGAHYATWPEELCVQPILMMCPERVCRTCGEPSRRIVETQILVDGKPGPGFSANHGSDSGRIGIDHNRVSTDRTTTGWTDCGHNDWRPGVVLDPFCGSGTSLQVATRLGRDAIGIDLDPRNEKLICARVGLFMGDVRTV
jgi:DNA modification methylase